MVSKAALYARRYRKEHPEKQLAAVLYTRKYRAEHPEKRLANNVACCLRSRDARASSKKEALERYGPNGVSKCSWVGCEVSDPDMLSLDHILDDGAEDRKKSDSRGAGMYLRLRRLGWPEGYQTLCMNHNFKKEAIRRRS
jgi:hypothetical protein